ncbi:hypothetical protein PSHT_14103 [Puccinia striiformis]|uniref:Uncharacterized protein n=1 Tax=Puccinia striiformis TaxID=27350 RepID=A0A2S4UM52_9BASI|nr:hypothetical protein PSHT_14103 [Puccinia striiformis]
MPSTSKLLCTCTSQGCSKHRYFDEGVIKHGQYVNATTRRSHRLLDERDRCFVQQALESARLANALPLLADYNPLPVAGEGLPEAFGAPGIQPSQQPSGIQSNSVLCPPDVQVIEEQHEEGPPKFDCAPLYLNTINKTPAMFIVNLKTVLFYVTQKISLAASSYLLKLDRQLIETVASQGLDPSIPPRLLSYPERIAINSFPNSTQTVIDHLGIDPDLSYSSAADETDDKPPDQEPLDTTPGEAERSLCGADLFCHRRSRRYPIRRFAFQKLQNWLARLFSRPAIEDALATAAARARSPYDATMQMSDIQDSRVWKEFRGPDGRQFTAEASNITFGMFMDGINPYGNRQAGKHASVTFIILVCLSLPVSLRYRPENIYIAGIAPGPKEPSLEEVNWIIRPVIEQLKSLWESGLYLSRTYQHLTGRLIHAALLPFFADLPALRRSLGFASTSAKRLCSYCLIQNTEINNIESESWPTRTLDDHRHWAKKSSEALNRKAQMKILDDHGVRYSALLELPYWNILEFHVVDSMHNLLLGLLKWHCIRFWLMSNVDDEQEPEKVSSRELHEILADALSNLPERPASPQSDDEEWPFANFLFGAFTDSSDTDFLPEDQTWDGCWVPPSCGKIIFDRDALSYINQNLKKLHIPTWIKRAIPVLGKTSFGQLKADEWRNLFTIQLPLILPVFWTNNEPGSQSLLHNFAHLVSLVNLALKRTMNKDRIDQYRHHLYEYIKSSLILFPESNLAPNHHMAFHLADCLERFGPCRAWWSFSMERLMGSVLKASTNNHLGELEITCLINFYRLANLRTLLDNPALPSSLEPCIRQIKSLYDPIPSNVEASRKPVTSLNEVLFQSLILRINELFPLPHITWTSSDKWDRIKSDQIHKFASLNSRITEVSQVVIGEHIVFSTFKKNENNSIIALKPNVLAPYGIIEKIFKHRRVTPDKLSYTDTWLSIQPLPPVLSAGDHSQPFLQLQNYNIGLTLRRITKSDNFIIHLNEILAHCAWKKYDAGEITEAMNYDTIALVCLDR